VAGIGAAQPSVPACPSRSVRAFRPVGPDPLAPPRSSASWGPLRGASPLRSSGLCGRANPVSLAAEERPAYQVAEGSTVDADGSSSTRDGPPASIAAVESSVQVLAGTDMDDLSDLALDELLRRLRRPIAQLVALRSRAAAASQSRRLAASPSGPTAATLREHQREHAAGQRLSASEAKREIEAGRAARDHQATRAAFIDGAIDPEQARMIARVLEELPPDRRDEVETELLALARRMDPVAFGRAARSVLAKQEPGAAARDERRRHLSRRVRASDTPDGGFAFSGLLYGAAAEHARVALDAFRRPDVSGEHRTPEQRSADAFEQLCAAALRSGAAPSAHGVRPHVVVVIDADQLAAYRSGGPAADARFAWSGQPVTSQEFGSLLSDCDLTRLVLDSAGTPIEASEAVRTVPIGLWRSLLVRDGGCTWEGCDAPASWCDVAHGHTAFAAAGRLSPDNAALLCRRHHRRFDNGGHRIVIDGNSVSYVSTDAPQVRVTDRDRSQQDRPSPDAAASQRHQPAVRRDRAPIAQPRAPDVAESDPPDTWDQTVLHGADPP
jgi:hypothetical protein